MTECVARPVKQNSSQKPHGKDIARNAAEIAQPMPDSEERENLMKPQPKVKSKGKVVPRKPKSTALAKTGPSKLIRHPKPEIIKAPTEAEMVHQAEALDKKIRGLEKQMKTGFVEWGVAFLEAEQTKAWKYLKGEDGKPYASMESWLKEACPFGRASGFAAKRAVRKLLGHIPKEEMKQLPRFAIETMAKLPKEKRANPKIREAAKKAAKKGNRREFIETVQQEAPEAHIDQSWTVAVDESARPIVDKAFRAAMKLYECANEAEALEFISTSFLESPCEIEAFSGLKNELALDSVAEMQAAGD